ncbi:MAG: 2-oxoglutarate dehydrogenase E1 component [Candidatus Sumerlaeia bacterium]|nr:2-oxoglutarate dehydrogenase E1 component [Candidatus Sumerlaeia bacterium]
MSPDSGSAASINSWSPDYLDSLYRQWQSDPDSLGADWQNFFRGFDLGHHQTTAADAELNPQWVEAQSRLESLQSRVDSLIYHYRDVGHLIARLDPLGRSATSHPLLELDAFGLSDDLLPMVFHAERIPTGKQRMTLEEIVDVLRRTYCGTIGVEYMHIQSTPERRWLQNRMEHCFNEPNFDAGTKLRIARLLRRAEAFERFLHTNYVGQKRFSLEGAETLIPLLDTLIQSASGHGVIECVMGMAHRGRLNVLSNVLNKAMAELFAEFEDNYEPGAIMGDGDVKYHKGYSTDVTTLDGREMHLTMTANPSHLEAVNPVVCGRVRAKQRNQGGESNRSTVLGILMHGDAAFAGQGVVAETLNLSQLKGYRTGGTIHVIINNQIGFTTLPHDARSGTYCTDVAKMIQAPIFHVNGDDPEAVCHAARIAVEYRQEFQKDVVIDMYCYRRHGHNEGDEPSFTQPRIYEMIRNHPSPYSVYAQRLVDEQVATQEELDRMAHEMDELMTAAQVRARQTGVPTSNIPFQREWTNYSPFYSHEPVETGAPEDLLQSVAEAWVRHPEGFTPNPKVERILAKRRDSVFEGHGIDWGCAESLAFGTLLAEGTPVRLSGQDSRRGTFSHRHAALWDINTAEIHIPLNHIAPTQARFCVYDSPLSEAAVLGFDYGYSLDNPDMLICWEAQFGDFANGAQTIIDQFIVSSESKWRRCSGLVLLLPHAYEGQGPEHSSGWLERFLQLSAEDNIQVCNVTTPAQYFHLLRRQIKRNFRKPLVLMSPKSLLRHPEVVSTTPELTSGHFREVLDDATVDPARVRRVVLCSGKVYYDLLAAREKNAAEQVALVRVEQFHPFPKQQLNDVLARYRGTAEEYVWCQEEPRNRGAWTYIAPLLEEECGLRVRYVGRARASSPAPGSLKRHQQEQKQIVGEALTVRRAAVAVSAS